MIVLPITLTIAAAAVLLNLWLGVRIARLRMVHKVITGDGGLAPLIARMRAQANFIENAPLFLILLSLVELAHGSATWLWLVGILFIVARIFHAFGMDRTGANPLRGAGFALTVLPMLGLAGYALATPYMMPAAAGTTTTAVDR